jgi:hypothetical protein
VDVGIGDLLIKVENPGAHGKYTAQLFLGEDTGEVTFWQEGKDLTRDEVVDWVKTQTGYTLDCD